MNVTALQHRTCGHGLIIAATRRDLQVRQLLDLLEKSGEWGWRVRSIDDTTAKSAFGGSCDCCRLKRGHAVWPAIITNTADRDQAMRSTHDKVIDFAGSRRISGVTWSDTTGAGRAGRVVIQTTIIPDIDRCATPPWQEYGDPTFVGDLAGLVGIPNGMSSGKPAVGLRIDLGDGKWVYVETSWATLSAAVAALRGPIPADALACPIAGCTGRRGVKQLMCRHHWYAVPKPLRDRVWATYKAMLRYPAEDTALRAYLQAKNEAIAEAGA